MPDIEYTEQDIQQTRDFLHWHECARTIPARPTAESIAAAKAAQQRERAEFEAATGLRLDDEGRVAVLLGNAMWLAVNGRWRGTEPRS